MTHPGSTPIRRMKTYTGGQGYVYQYYFVGKRAAPAPTSDVAATEYIFDVTSDRKTTFAVSVFLPEKAVQAWAASHGRPLTDAEQYGAERHTPERVECDKEPGRGWTCDHDVERGGWTHHPDDERGGGVTP